MKITRNCALIAAAAVLSANGSPLPSSQHQLAFLQSSSPATAWTTSAYSLLSSLTSATLDVLTPRLVQTSHDTQPYWALPHFLRWKGVAFFDVTDHLQLGKEISFLHLLDHDDPPSFPTQVSYKDHVSKVHSNLSETEPRLNLAAFTSFTNRYYKSSSGKDSQRWLLAKLREYTAERKDIVVEEFPHPWGQNSIIVKIPSTDQKAAEKNGRIVVGAHQDSVNLIFPYLPAPGADDDGSGTVTQLESLRALLALDWKPSHNDVEFHFYSAEEGGLLGSQAVASAYVQAGKKVKAMSQFDMTAFVKQGTNATIGVITDVVSPELTAFNRLLIEEYLDVPWVNTQLGYAGSDHASWTKVGVPSAFSVEAKFDDCNLKRIHTTSDTFNHAEFSFEHILRFSRLSSAFIIELAGWGK